MATGVFNDIPAIDVVIDVGIIMSRRPFDFSLRS
jgi:hypothetical protein